MKTFLLILSYHSVENKPTPHQSYYPHETRQIDESSLKMIARCPTDDAKYVGRGAQWQKARRLSLLLRFSGSQSHFLFTPYHGRHYSDASTT